MSAEKSRHFESNSIDQAAIEAAWRRVDREVWIVTSCANGRRGGLTATWVNRASLDPAQPTMLIGLAPNHFTTELIHESNAWGLHLLSKENFDLALDFALGSGRDRDKLAGLPYRLGASGAPILDVCLAWFDCRRIATYETGDRVYFWGEIVAGGQDSGGVPLREKELLASARPEQLAALRDNLLRDLEISREAATRWRSRQADGH